MRVVCAVALALLLTVLAAGARAEADIDDEIGGSQAAPGVPPHAASARDEIGGEEIGDGGRPHRPPRGPGAKSGDMMVLYAAAGFFLVLAAGVGKWAASQGHEKAAAAAPGGVRQGAADEAEVAGGGAARRNALARMRARRQAGGDGADSDEGEFEGAGKKIGAKKLAKLEQKEEKRAMREAMEEEKARRREKQELEEEAARERRQAELDKEKKEAEEEAKRIAEAKKKEEEEFDKWKDMFETGEDGAQAEDDLQENQGMLQEFIDYLKAKKIAPLDEVASEFKLKAQEVVNRVEGLEAMGRITGLLDDRGKFIYISLEEMEAVAKWIQTQGRLSISDLASHSNKLVDLQTKEVPRASAGGEQEATGA